MPLWKKALRKKSDIFPFHKKSLLANLRGGSLFLEKSRFYFFAVESCFAALGLLSLYSLFSPSIIFCVTFSVESA